MKLIIDIPEEVVTSIQNGEDYRYDIHTAIAQGTSVSTEGDLISLSALKDDIDFQYICKCCHNVNGKFCDICPIPEIEKKIDNAPTVELKKGMWIDKDIYYECPFCHAGYLKSICEKTLELSKMNFCFNCGSDMRGDENG